MASRCASASRWLFTHGKRMMKTDVGRETDDPQILHVVDAWWRAANYLSVGQIYLRANPLLRVPLKLEHVKRTLVGHWGTTPGQNFIYAHLNRAIRQHDLDMIYLSGPGHGGPAVVANAYLEGTYSEVYPEIGEDEAGLQRLFRQFSFPGGIGSHATPECPGSIHEGGELGYSLSHAFGAVLDNPDLIAACVVGDGEAETGPLATSWHSNKFLDPVTDGTVLPILHLNGYKIANPAVPARIAPREPAQLLRGCGWKPYLVSGSQPASMHRQMAEVLAAATSRATGGLGAELPAGRTLRREGKPACRVARAGAARPATHEREPACERRAVAARVADAGFPCACRGSARAGRRRHWRHACVRPVPPRSVACQPRPAQFPDVRARRDRVERPGSRVRRDLPPVAAADPCDRRVPGPRRTRAGNVERTSMPGLAGGLPVDRPPRLVQLLRGVRAHRGFDVQPAHQVAEDDRGAAVAAAHRFAQLPAGFARVAAGPQRLHPPGPRIHRPRGQQEGGNRARVPAAGRQLPVVGDGPLPAQPALRQRRSRGQASRAAVAGHRRSGRALRARHRGLAVGRQRPERRTGCGHGLRGRRADAGNAGRRFDPAPLPAGPEAARGQRGGPDEAATGQRASARPGRRRLRSPVHAGPPRDLRVPRLSDPHPPPDLPAPQPREFPRARLQGGGHDHHAVRHDGPERPRPLPPGAGRDRARAGTCGKDDPPEAEARGQARRALALHPRGRRGPAGSARVVVVVSGCRRAPLSMRVDHGGCSATSSRQAGSPNPWVAASFRASSRCESSRWSVASNG